MSDMTGWDDLASNLQATKDDQTEWGDAEPVPASRTKSEKRRLTAMVSVRLTPEELEALQEHSRMVNATVSGYLRALAIADIGRSEGYSGGDHGFRVINASDAVIGSSTTTRYARVESTPVAV